jgi:hypothetical protein
MACFHQLLLHKLCFSIPNKQALHRPQQQRLHGMNAQGR